MHDHVGAECGEQRQRRDVVAQLAVVVVLDDEEALGPGPVHERDPPARRQPRTQRELVRRRAVDGRQPGREGVDDQPVAVDGHRDHVESGAPQRLDGPLVAGLLDGDPRAARQGPGQLGDRRGRSARGHEGARVGGQAAMAQEVRDDGFAERRQPDRVGHDVGRLVGGRAPGPPPGGAVSAATQGVPGAQVDRRRLGRRRVESGSAAGLRTPGGTATTNVPAPRRPATHPSASSWS